MAELTSNREDYESEVALDMDSCYWIGLTDLRREGRKKCICAHIVYQYFVARYIPLGPQPDSSLLLKLGCWRTK